MTTPLLKHITSQTSRTHQLPDESLSKSAQNVVSCEKPGELKGRAKRIRVRSHQRSSEHYSWQLKRVIIVADSTSSQWNLASTWLNESFVMLSNFNMTDQSMKFLPRVHVCMRKVLTRDHAMICKWGGFDFRVCHPNAESSKSLEPQNIYSMQENEKKHQYSMSVCDDGTHAGDNLNYSYGCSSSMILVQWYLCETLLASELRGLSSKMAAVLM